MAGTPLVVILTALDVEYAAVREHLRDLAPHRHRTGTRFETGTVDGADCRIALGLTGVGNAAAAVLAERAIQEFAPTAVLYVGVAGALWDTTPLGDIVFASRVYAYHGGTSEDDGLKSRPRAWEAPHSIQQLAHEIARDGAWARRLPGPVPAVHFKPIAAGEIVQCSRISREAQWIRQHYNDAFAIEMEAAGVAQAGHLSGRPVAVVRGLSDGADGRKTQASDSAWQPRAAGNAAAFAIELAARLTGEAESAAEPDRTGDRPAGASGLPQAAPDGPVIRQYVVADGQNAIAQGVIGGSINHFGRHARRDDDRSPE